MRFRGLIGALVASLAIALAMLASSASGAQAGSALRLAGQHVSHPATIACRRGYYKNVSGHCIRRPSHDPAGATAKCRDGTYSYSEHASGTCSHHGGVARWIHHP